MKWISREKEKVDRGWSDGYRECAVATQSASTKRQFIGKLSLIS